MKNNNLIFFQIISSIKIKLLNNVTIFILTIVDLNIFIFSKEIQILPRRYLNSKRKLFFIYNIDAKSFDLLIK